MISLITDYLVRQSWQIAVLAFAVAMVSLLLRNRSAHVRYLLWLIVLAKCLVPPLFTVPIAVLPESSDVEPVVVSEVVIPAAPVEVIEAPISEPYAAPVVPVTPLPAPGFLDKLADVSIEQWLVFAWVGGTFGFALIVFVKGLRTNRWLRRNRSGPGAELNAGIECFFAESGVKARPKVWLVEGIGQPFVWGLVRGSIYLPVNFAQIRSDKDIRGILGHELSHVVRFDAGINLLQIIAQAIFWFHPLVWWVNIKIRGEREKCCDEMAIASLGAKAKEYGTAIVNTLIAEHKAFFPIPSLAVSGPARNIEDRIRTIMSPGKKFYRRPTFVTVVTILVLAAIAVPTTLALTRRAAKERAAEIERRQKMNAREVAEGFVRAAVAGELVKAEKYCGGELSALRERIGQMWEAAEKQEMGVHEVYADGEDAIGFSSVIEDGQGRGGSMCCICSSRRACG